VKKEKLKEWALTGSGSVDVLTQKKNNFMQNVNEKILEDYRLVVTRLDLMKAEVDEVNRANFKLRKAFNELLDIYQEELSRRESTEDSQEVAYYWCDKAGILD
jgi:uncharacterized protein YoxC